MTDLPAWLPPALDYVRQWLGYQMRASEQPGCAIAVVWRGQVVLDEAFGHADLGAGEALTPRHRHRVASHSKTFTAAAVMKLREQGRVSLDDPAGKYVAGLHPDIARVTVSQLLSHTAGVMRDGPDCAYWAGRAPFLDDAGLRAELAMAPAIEAGVRLKYSNHGFGLAGLIIEAITGEPYGVWVKREIVDVAGLAETTPDVPLPVGAALARGHSGKALLGRRLVFAGDQATGVGDGVCQYRGGHRQILRPALACRRDQHPVRGQPAGDEPAAMEGSLGGGGPELWPGDDQLEL